MSCYYAILWTDKNASGGVFRGDWESSGVKGRRTALLQADLQSHGQSERISMGNYGYSLSGFSSLSTPPPPPLVTYAPPPPLVPYAPPPPSTLCTPPPPPQYVMHPPQYVMHPLQLQSACHCIVNHYVKI